MPNIFLQLSGAILGRAGLHLHHVCVESGANVVLNDGIRGTTDRLITVSGSTDQVDSAYRLLQIWYG